jgi:diguanylate cyclase (GGDEF)-like protein
MNELFSTYFDILILAGVLSTVLAIITLRRQNIPGSISLSVSSLSVVIWTITSAFEINASTISSKILWTKIGYIGVLNLIPFFLFFILIYTGKLKSTENYKLIGLWILSFVLLLLVWTNDLHHLVWSSFSEINAANNMMIYFHGPVYWIIIVFNYSIMGVILYILINEFRKATHFKYRWQILLMMLAAMFPMAGGIIYISGLNPIPGLDWAPIGGFLAVLVLIISVFAFHFMDLVPVARELLLEQMDIGVMVIDPKHRIVDLNASIIKLFPLYGLSIGLPVEKFFESIGINQDLTVNPENSVIIEFGEQSSEMRFIELKLTQLKKEKILLGWLVSFRDISEQKRSSLKIESINNDLIIKLGQIEKLKKDLEEMAIRDPLTNVYNRRFFDEAFEKEMARSKRRGTPLCITMIDIDHFKRINDEFGHAVGDRVLKNFGSLLLAKTRKGDVVCRYGGEEFIILFPDADDERTLKRLNEIREEFRNMCLQEDSLNMDVTISLGVACFPHHGNDPRKLIQLADKALYDAKDKGRNQVAIAQ